MNRFPTRRAVAVLGALMLAAAAAPALAQDWRVKYPALVFAQVANENASTTTNASAPFVEYLSRKLGVKVTLRVANDYAAVIEGQRAGHIHIGNHGPSSL